MAATLQNSVDVPRGASRRQPLVLVLAAMAVGIMVDRYWPLPAEAWWLAAAGGVFVWAGLWLARQEWASSAVLLVAIGAAGGAWHHDRWNLYAADEIALSLREEIRPHAIEAIAITTPRWVPAPPPTALRTIPKGDETEVLLWITAIRDGRVWRPASGWASMDVDGHLLGVRAGDRIRVMALASQPMRPLNPGEFNYANFERSRRIFCRIRGLFPENVTLIDRGSEWSPRLWLGKVRQRGNAVLRRYVDRDRATLAAAILIGAREQLDADRNEGFLVTGTIHILSISGLHVGILAYGFWVLFRTGVLPRRFTLAAAMLLTVMYALLTDLQPPVVRATILVLVLCAATWIGRRGLGFNSLAFAGIVVLALNPLSLFQAGTQLSFLAVMAMILFSPILVARPSLDPLDRLVASVRPWPIRWSRRAVHEIWRVWLTGAVIWLVSLPLVWQQYCLVSPIALVLNTIVWIPISVSLYAGFGVLLLGWIFPFLAHPCGWLCDRCLWFIERSIDIAQGTFGSYFWSPPPPWWWVAAFYVAFGLCAAFPALRPRRLWVAAMVAMWVAVALLLSSQGRMFTNGSADRPLACTFVAVGHGTSCLLELPDGKTLLYDAGKLGSPMGSVRPISAVLWSRGITHLDAVVVSHADSDHFNALPELLSRFSVGVVYTSPLMFEDLPPAVRELREAIEQSGVPLREISAGERLRTSPTVTLEVLHPPRKGVIGSDNANSIVLLTTHHGRRVLLPGDLESPGLEDLLAELPLDCDVIMAPHHGSRRSDPAGFAAWSTPEHVVISGGRNVEDIPSIEAVKDSFRQAGGAVYHTAEHGSVRFLLTKDRVEVATFRKVQVRVAGE